MRNKIHFIMLVVLLSMAFARGVGSVQGLHYGYELDSDRDLGTVQNILEGNLWNDPGTIGEYIWYNPLVTYMQAFFVKVTGCPAATLATQAGAYLNLLAPICFFLMLVYLFNFRIAIASLVSYLFFSSGNLNSSIAATYSPWLYPAIFMQTFFYLGIIVIDMAFKKAKLSWFILAGIVTGITLLGHTGPAIILLFVFAYLFVKEILNYALTGLGSGIVKFLWLTFSYLIVFVLVSLPILYFVIGKYKLHTVNFAPAEYLHPLFDRSNFVQLLRENLSLSLAISIVGLMLFFLGKMEFKNKRHIVLGWLYSCMFLFVYCYILPIFRLSFGVKLPDIVPTLHFFFYLKALQSALFGIGFFWLSNLLFKRLNSKRITPRIQSFIFSTFLLVISFFYYPSYCLRTDFVQHIENGLERNRDTSKIEIYKFLLSHTNINDVVVSDESMFAFPVMASGRKQVAAAAHFSNPYIDYIKRDNDRCRIIDSMLVGNVNSVLYALKKYKVKYILLESGKINHPEKLNVFFGTPCLKNKKYCIYRNVIT